MPDPKDPSAEPEPEPDPISVSARCVVVVRTDGVFIQEPTFAPRLAIDAPRLALLTSIDAEPTNDTSGCTADVASASGSTEAELNEFLFGLRVAKYLIVGPRASHGPTADHPSLASEPPPADLDSGAIVDLCTPLTLRLVDGRFELIDHYARRTARLSAADASAMGSLGAATTARRAFDRQRAAAGSLALDESGFARLIARLEVAGVLRLRDPDTTPIRSAAMADADDATGGSPAIDASVKDTFDRHAAAQTEAERAREQRTGQRRIKVIPVAFDMSTPTALGMIMAYAKVHAGGGLEDIYDFRTDWVWSEDRLEEFTATPAVYLFSNYLWSHQRCIAVSKRIKELSPGSITIHGGPDTPKYENDMYAYFDAHPHVDVTVRGEGEVTAAELLEALAPVLGPDEPDLSVLHDVAGIGFRDRDGVHRTGNRDRVAELDILPSPFLTGLFDIFTGTPDLFVTLETNRGCPYGCTFCDWGSATTSRIRKFDIERVFAEIDWCSAHGIASVSVADANFGIFARDVDIAQRVAEQYREHGTPRAFGVSYAKNTVKHVRSIISILADAGIMTQGVLALQTMDPETLDVIHRSNIKTDQYDQLANEMRTAKLPLMVELMMGLPGQTLGSFADDLQQCIDRGVPARINRTTLLVNSPMNEPAYLEEHRIETDDPVGPGLNTAVVATASFTRDDYRAMNLLRADFMLYENWSALRHVARFVRQETGVREIDFYRLIRSRTTEQPQEWPALHALVAVGADLMAPPHSWALMLGDLRRFLVSEMGLAPDAALDSILAAQLALLPTYGRAFPELVMLDHDVVAWTEATIAAKAQGRLHDWDHHAPRLGDFGPGQLVVDDPDDIVGTSIGVNCDMNVIGFNWEFDSPLSRASVAANQFSDLSLDGVLASNKSDTEAGTPVAVKLANASG